MSCLGVIFEDFPKICRLCLKSGDLQPLLHVAVLGVFSTITDIKVNENDKLPENVCGECITQLVYISTFIDACRSNDEFLRTIAQKEFGLLAKEQNINSPYHQNNVKNEDDDVKSENDDDDVKSENDDDDVKSKNDDDDVKSENDDDDDDDVKSENSNEFYAEDIKYQILPNLDIHAADLPSTCLNCNETFSNQKSLYDHYVEAIVCRPSDFELHNPDEPKIVEFLRKGGKRVRKSHSRSNKDPLSDGSEFLKGRKAKGKRRLLCCYCLKCNKKFPNQKCLYDHYIEAIVCRPSDFDLDDPDEPNIVDYLKKRAPRVKKEPGNNEPEFVKGRELKGKRRFLCCYCGKNYTRKNGLDRHILSHTGVKPFECKECGKRYITKDTLKTHILTHTGVKAYKCTVCQKSFTQSSHLSYHMRRHSGEKPFSCSFCGKAFLSSYHLERHKLMHTGVKPFQCKLCLKQFVRGTTLRDHLLIHSGEKPFVCQHCGKQFNRKQSLTNHVLVHTGGHTRNSGDNASLALANNLVYSEPNPIDSINSGY